MDFEKDAEQEEIKRLRTQLHELQTSQRQLLGEVAKLKKNNVAPHDDEATHNNSIDHAHGVQHFLQDMHHLKQRMEAQRKMFKLTINVYRKEKIQCVNELTKDELKMQKKLHKLISQKKKLHLCDVDKGSSSCPSEFPTSTHTHTHAGIGDHTRSVTAAVRRTRAEGAGRGGQGETRKVKQASAEPTRRCSPPRIQPHPGNCSSVAAAASDSSPISAPVPPRDDSTTAAAASLNRQCSAPLQGDPDAPGPTPRQSPPEHQNQVIFCRSCSPPHDRAQLPACFQPASNLLSKPALASTLSEASCSGLGDESLRRPPSPTPSTPHLLCFQTPRSQSGLGFGGDLRPRPLPPVSSCFISLDPSPARTRVPSFDKLDDGSCAQSVPVSPSDSSRGDTARDSSQAPESEASKWSLTVTTASQPSRQRSSSKQRRNPCLSMNSSSSVSIPPSDSSSSLDSKLMPPSCFSFSTLYASPPKSPTSSRCTTPVLTQTLNSSMFGLPFQHPFTHPSEPIPFGSDPSHIPDSHDVPQIPLPRDSHSDLLSSPKQSHDPLSPRGLQRHGCTSGTHLLCGEEEETQSFHSENGEESYDCTYMSESLLLSLTSLQPPPTTHGGCQTMKEVVKSSKSEAKSRNSQPSSKPRCFNFSVPRPLSTTCSKSPTVHVDSSQGFSQTFEATPRESVTSPPFSCLPFGSCVQTNVHPITSHSCTQTSTLNLLLKNTPNSENM